MYMNRNGRQFLYRTGLQRRRTLFIQLIYSVHVVFHVAMHQPISVAPSLSIQTTHNAQFLDSLRRRANARNVSFGISLRWPIYIINPVDKTKLSCNTPHRGSTTDSLESYLLYSKNKANRLPVSMEKRIGE